MLRKFCSFSNIVTDDDTGRWEYFTVSRVAERVKIISHAYARRGSNTEVRYLEKARGAPLTTVRYLHTSH